VVADSSQITSGSRQFSDHQW